MRGTDGEETKGGILGKGITMEKDSETVLLDPSPLSYSANSGELDAHLVSVLQMPMNW